MTSTQLATLRFINLRLESGVSPTLREIAVHFSISKISAYGRLLILRRDGYVMWETHGRRTLQLTNEGRRCIISSSSSNDRSVAAVQDEREAWTAMLRSRATRFRSQAETYSAAEMVDWADECNRTADLLEELIETMGHTIDIRSRTAPKLDVAM